jgi:NAD(P)-dependent dehydrogenase (short-subunit alcohol dehydrogenase family)
VVVASRTKQEIEAVAAEIKSAGGRALAVPMDVTQEEQVQDMVGHTVEAFGRVDILVNNAGVPGPMDLITEIKEEEWDRTLDTNLKGIFLCAKAVVPHMMEHGGGNIINISSGAGFKRPRQKVRSLPYNVSKFGLEGLTHVLAVQLKEHNICVNSLLPGVTDTRFHEHTPADWLARMPEMGKSEDVMEAAVFLATQNANSMTDQALNVREWNQAHRSQS